MCLGERRRGRESGREGWREERMDGGREEGFNPAWIMGQTGAGEQEEIRWPETEEVVLSVHLTLHPGARL